MDSTKIIALCMIIAMLFPFGYSHSLVNDNLWLSSCTSEVQSDTKSFTSASDVNFLIMIDNGYGTSYRHVLAQFESYGWTITVAGTNETTDPYYCASPLNVDISIWEIDDITQYDAISIMPGHDHDILRTNQTALDLISTSVDAGVIVSAWCRAVRVLAAADVIDGKNITGHADYVSEYEAAGATFNELVPPIIDGNIVTGVRSRFYRTEMCLAIASALEVFDSVPLELNETMFSSEIIHPNNSTIFTASFTDESGVAYAKAELYLLTIQGERNTTFSPISFILDSSDMFIFTGNISGLQVGNYTVDLTARDLYSNSIIFSDVGTLVVENPPNTDSILLSDPIIIGGVTILAGVLVIFVVIKMKKE